MRSQPHSQGLKIIDGQKGDRHLGITCDGHFCNLTLCPCLLECCLNISDCLDLCSRVASLKLNAVLHSIYFFSSWIFEVWVDKGKLLGNLTICQAIASFLHLCFSFNLEYPKASIDIKIAPIVTPTVFSDGPDYCRHLAEEVFQVWR